MCFNRSRSRKSRSRFRSICPQTPRCRENSVQPWTWRNLSHGCHDRGRSAPCSFNPQMQAGSRFQTPRLQLELNLNCRRWSLAQEASISYRDTGSVSHTPKGLKTVVRCGCCPEIEIKILGLALLTDVWKGKAPKSSKSMQVTFWTKWRENSLFALLFFCHWSTQGCLEDFFLGVNTVKKGTWRVTLGWRHSLKLQTILWRICGPIKSWGCSCSWLFLDSKF